MFIIKHILGKIISSIVAAIQLVIIILRFLNIITWPWYKVFSPIIISALLCIVFSLLIRGVKRIFKKG